MATATKSNSSYHDRRVKKRLADPEYRAEYERALRQIRQIPSPQSRTPWMRRSWSSRAAMAIRAPRGAPLGAAPSALSPPKRL